MAQSDEQFLRAAEVIIGPRISGQNAPQEPPGAKSFKSNLVQDASDPSSFTSGFRIAFGLSKDQQGKPNKAKITLYNLSQASRNFLEDEKLIVFLKAGYVGRISTIFFGDLSERETSRQGPDIITILDCADQEKILQTANVQIGLGAGATNIQAFEAAESAMGLTIPSRQKALITVKQFVNGFSFTGTAQKLMEKLVKEIGFTFSVQDGEIQILGENSNDEQEAVLVTPDTGLIGFPTKTQRGAKFKALLNPEIRVGRAIALESKQFQGALGASADVKASQSLIGSGLEVTAKKVTMNGDSQDGAWETIVEGVTSGEPAEITTVTAIPVLEVVA